MNDAGAGSETDAPAPRKPPARLRRSILSVFGTELGVLVLGVANTVLATRVLGPTGRGQVVLALNVATLVQATFHLGVPWSVNYFVARGQGSASAKRDTVGALWRLVPFVVAMWLLSYAVVFALRRVPFLKGLTPVLLGLSALFAILLFLRNTQASFFAGLKDFRSRNSLWVAMPGLVVLALVVNMALSFRLTANIVVGLNVLASILTVGAGLAILTLKHHAPIWAPGEALFTREFLRYGMRFYIGLLAQVLNYRLDSFIVNAFLGNAQLGLYSTAVAVAELLLLVPTAVNIVVYPTVSSLQGEARDRLAMLATGATLYVVALLALVWALAVDWIIPMAFGPAFAGSVAPARWLLPGMAAIAVVRVLCHAAAGAGHPEVLTYTTVAGLVLTVPLDFLLIPRSGIVGAAVASSLAYSLSGIMVLLLYRRTSRLSVSNILSGVFVEPGTWAVQSIRARRAG